MAKIRVYELATKLGLDNKEIVDKLNQAGIEVKNHMSALEEEVALKFEAGQSTQADENVEVKVKEERISSGLIRRRRKTVVVEEPEPEVVVAEEPAPAVTEEVAPAVEEVAEEKEVAPAVEAAEEAPTDVEPVEAEIAPSQVHRTGHPGSGGTLELEAQAALASYHQEVELGATVGSPEEALFAPRPQPIDHFGEREAFPRGAQLGMALQAVAAPEVEQRVKQPGVTYVHLRRLDLALADVLEPGG